MLSLSASARLGLSCLALTACLLTGGLLLGRPAPALAAPSTTAGTSAQSSSGFVDKSGTDTSAPGKEYALTSMTGDTALQPLIGRIARIVVGISGSLALLLFVWAGITMMRANGDAKLIEKGKRIMVWTVIGLLVIFGSEAAIRAILNTLLKGSAV